MKRIAIASIAVFASVSMGQMLETTSVWSIVAGGNGHTYELFSFQGGINWADAQAAAVARGGYLATITSLAENEFIYNSLAIGSNNGVWHIDIFNSQIGPWLGGFQPAGSPEPAGGWQWVTGENFAFTNWSSDEPNNSGGTENRLHFFGNPGRTSRWNDVIDTVLIEGYVVETVPSPAPVAVFALAGLAGLHRRR